MDRVGQSGCPYSAHFFQNKMSSKIMKKKLIINRKNIVVNILKFNSNIWVIDIHKPKQPTQRIWNNTKNGNNFYSFDEAKIFYKYDYKVSQ